MELKSYDNENTTSLAFMSPACTGLCAHETYII